MLLLFFTVFVLVRGISGSDGGNSLTVKLICSKVGCVFPMFFTSEFRLKQYRDYTHREEALILIVIHALNNTEFYKIMNVRRWKRNLVLTCAIKN